MSRQDGMISGDIALELLVGHQLDAAVHGASQASRVIGGRPDQLLQDLSRDVNNLVQETARTVHSDLAQPTESSKRVSITSFADIELNFESVTTITQAIEQIGDHCVATIRNLRALLASTEFQQSATACPDSAAKVQRRTEMMIRDLRSLHQRVRLLSPTWYAMIAAFQNTDSILELQLQRLRRNLTATGSTLKGMWRIGLRTASTSVRMPLSTGLSAMGATTYLSLWRAAIFSSVVAVSGVAAGSVGASALKASTSDNGKQFFTANELEESAGQFLDNSPLNFDGIMRTLGLAWSLAGHGDAAVTKVRLNQNEQQQMNTARTAFRDKIRTAALLNDHFGRPTSVADLLTHAAEIDALGGPDTAVLRVIVKECEPPRFTLVLPSTKHWYSNSPIPNDLASNISIMAGDESALLSAAKQALDETISDYKTVGSKPHIAVVGFSQGGITAARFAQRYEDEFTIAQIVTAGAPIARIDVPASTDVLSIENAEDHIVPRLDLRPDRDSTQRTIVHADRGGHNALDYAANAAALIASAPTALSGFMVHRGDRASIHDHHIRRAKSKK